jgi:eukaryotic-like serine/threonine-protein kinase
MKCEACGHENVDGARFCASCGAIQATPADGPDPLIGQLIGGRYRVTGIIGEGGMGKVYVGEQQMGSTVRKVAIKTLHPHLSKDPSVLQRFHRECGTVAQLEHPNTIKFYDFGSTADGTLYIAMEFVAGRSLSETIEKEGALPPDRVVKIMRQVCGALDEAHQKGIIHRDLKPDNVVLTDQVGETDFVKVLDFGIAARSESADAQKEQKLTQQGMVLGTPPYMSPEQFTGKALDGRSDVYSLGVMVYEMLTGRLPFGADTPWQWATQHMTAQPISFEVSAPNKNLPGGMRDAILKALSKDRDQRQATARDFFGELSGGGRMTVEAAPMSPAAAHADTAAMNAVPNFGVAPAGLAPAMSPVMAAPMAAPAIPVAPPMARRQGGGGKGLLIGLGALGVVLLVAMAVVFARSMKPSEEEPALEGLGEPSAVATETKIAPTETEVPGPTAVPTPTAVETAPPTPTKTPTPTPTKTTPKPTTAGGSSSTAPTPTKPSGSGDACETCLTQARSGNVAGAVSALNSCADDAKKRACRSRIGAVAPRAAQQAAFNGNCAGAKAIIQAAKAAGAGTPRLDSALDRTSCK